MSNTTPVKKYKIDASEESWENELDREFYLHFHPGKKVHVKELLENGEYGTPETFFDPNDDPREKIQ